MRSSPIFLIAALFVLLVPASLWSQNPLHSSPVYHTFGKVNTGTSKSFTIQVTNTTGSTVRIVSKKTAAPFSIGTFPAKLNAGASAPLTITFKPTAAGHVAGLVAIVSSASSAPLKVGVQGTGLGGTTPELGISPTTLNFGNVNVGASATLPATLAASNAPVTISSDQSNSSEFVIQGIKLPVTIAAGSSLPVTIQFTPTSSGTAITKAGFISNAVNTPTVAQLTGTGVAASSHSVDLSWSRGSATAVGYNVYRSTTSGGSYSRINSALEASTSYVDSAVAAGTTYYYATTEVNAQGQESNYSNVATATVPTP